MSGLVVGIVPGLGGALALFTSDGTLVELYDMPVLEDGAGGRRAINAALLAICIRSWQPGFAFVELIGPGPGEGPVGAFGFGRLRGLVEGVLGALSIPAEMVAPAWWKRRAGIAPGPDRKDEARSKAIARWQRMAEHFARKRADGRAEAALIGWAGLQRRAVP